MHFYSKPPSDFGCRKSDISYHAYHAFTTQCAASYNDVIHCYTSQDSFDDQAKNALSTCLEYIMTAFAESGEICDGGECSNCAQKCDSCTDDEWGSLVACAKPLVCGPLHEESTDTLALSKESGEEYDAVE